MPRSKIELQYECYLLSKDYEFPDNIEIALENDYVENPHLYDRSTFKRLQVYKMLGVENDVSIAEVLGMVRIIYKDRFS